MQKVEKLLGAMGQTPLGDSTPQYSTTPARMTHTANPRVRQIDSRAKANQTLTLSMQSGLSASTYLFGQSEVDSEEPSPAAQGGVRLGRCGARPVLGSHLIESSIMDLAQESNSPRSGKSEELEPVSSPIFSTFQEPKAQPKYFRFSAHRPDRLGSDTTQTSSLGLQPRPDRQGSGVLCDREPKQGYGAGAEKSAYTESCWTTSTPDGDGAAEAPEPSISAAPEPSVSATPEMSPSGRKIEKPAGSSSLLARRRASLNIAPLGT
ncbi:unnamed protein product [Effrenium voratum]|nr:unnamed protein product [Effrenium voratum]